MKSSFFQEVKNLFFELTFLSYEGAITELKLIKYKPNRGNLRGALINQAKCLNEIIEQ